jgi:flagellar motility protein MotE (MotC chaperone)
MRGLKTPPHCGVTDVATLKGLRFASHALEESARLGGWQRACARKRIEPLTEKAFPLRDIPELQESEDEQSKRDIAEINAGLKTINDVLKERGKELKPWGDVWYRNKNLISIGENGKENKKSPRQATGY